MAKRALVLIADGTEEMEFTITYDTLKRAGVECTSAYVRPQSTPHGSLDDRPVLAVCSRGVKIQPDTTLELCKAESEEYDVLVIPGGFVGAQTLSQSKEVQTLVRNYVKRKKIVAMICAGSLAALTADLPRQALTSHPVVQESLSQGFDYKEDPVVVSNLEDQGTLVTSRGPGTTFPFAFKLVELLCGPAKRDEVREPMMFPPALLYPY